MAARSIATAPSNSLPPSYRGLETPSTLDTVSLILGGIVIIAAVAAVIDACIPKMMQPLFSPKLNCKVPCDRCRYFNHNPYVKCALHPDTVLTEQAIDCRDYHSGSMAEPFDE